MPGYVTTSYTGEGSKCVYALDCEMCYTTEGLELTRVSVVDMSLKPVYENIVKPCHTIVDYNTRYVCVVIYSMYMHLYYLHLVFKTFTTVSEISRYLETRLPIVF